MNQNISSTQKSLFRFLVVGGLTAIIFFFTDYVSTSVLGLLNEFSITLAFLASTLFQFFLNLKFSFVITPTKTPSKFIKYLFLVLMNYLITLFVVSILTFYFDISRNIALLCSLIFTVTTGFIVSRFWVYK